jgi:hypothetical protein
MKSESVFITLWLAFSILLLQSSGITQPCVLFDGSAGSPGTQYGSPSGHTTGNLILSEEGINVYLLNFYPLTGPPLFDYCEVDQPFAGFGFGKTMRINDICLEFYFGFLSTIITSVRFSFADFGNDANISIGSIPPYIGPLTYFTPPTDYTFSVETHSIPGGIRGKATITGPSIDTLIIGGKDLWLDSICVVATTGIYDGEFQETSIQESFVLNQNFPNPFNSTTTIHFEVPSGWIAPVTLRIFNVQGQHVKTIIDDLEVLPGTHQVVWNGKDAMDKEMPSGIYFCHLTSAQFITVRKMFLAR